MVVMHHVQLAGGLTFSPSLTILPTGHLEQVAPGFIYSQAPMTVAGTLSGQGFLGPGCPIILSGSIFAGSLYLGGGMQLMGGLVWVTGNFTQAAGTTVDGDGQICVGDSSNIQGPLTGTIDLCDLTPTTTVPPFVDGGANFVGPGITFCQASFCELGVSDRATDLSLTAFPIPATSEVTLTGVLEGQLDLRVMNALGAATAVQWARRGDRIVMQVDGLAMGLYLVEVRSAGRSGVVRFVKE
jgi:hypothetical protein